MPVRRANGLGGPNKASEYLSQMELRFPFLFRMDEAGKLTHLLGIMLFIRRSR